MKRTFRLCASMLVAFMMCFVAASCDDDDDEGSENTSSTFPAIVEESLGVYSNVTHRIYKWDEEEGDFEVIASESEKTTGKISKTNNGVGIKLEITNIGTLSATDILVCNDGYDFNTNDFIKGDVTITSKELPKYADTLDGKNYNGQYAGGLFYVVVKEVYVFSGERIEQLHTFTFER